MNNMAPTEIQAPAYPASWIWFCEADELNGGPITKEVLGRRLVAFRTQVGRACVLDSHCVHMGADLGSGDVVGETIRCPFHHWRFDGTGQCVDIPATEQIPCFAKQPSFSTTESRGEVYFFNGPEPLYPLPFFEAIDVSQLSSAGACNVTVDMPWYMVGINAVDIQHFRIAHDRRLLDQPLFEFSTPFLHQTTCKFEVAGNTIRDWLTRKVAGSRSVMAMSDWASTIILVKATFQRTETFGIVDCVPLTRQRTLVRFKVFVRKSRRRMLGGVFDFFNARVRRYFVRKFLEADIERCAGTDANRNTLIDVDQPIAGYLQWLDGLPKTAPPTRSKPTGTARLRNNAIS
jgi:aminopyrrolnitrin oxygenase